MHPWNLHRSKAVFDSPVVGIPKEEDRSIGGLVRWSRANQYARSQRHHSISTETLSG